MSNKNNESVDSKDEKIEEQITSMLDKVLSDNEEFDDQKKFGKISDDEGMPDFNNVKPNYLNHNNYATATISIQHTEVINPPRIFINDVLCVNSVPQMGNNCGFMSNSPRNLSPRLCLSPRQYMQQPMKEKSPRLSPSNIFSRSPKKNNTVNYASNTLNIINTGKNLGVKFNTNLTSSPNMRSGSNQNLTFSIPVPSKSPKPSVNNVNIFNDFGTYSTTESYGSNDGINVQTPRKSADNLKNLGLDDFDIILETKVRPNEVVDEEVYKIFKGNFFNILTTQNGSRVLQKALKNTRSDIIFNIFHEIKTKLHELMVDSYANYFCQKFFSCLEDKERIKFLLNIKDHVEEIGNSKVGTYPLQAVLDQLKSVEEKNIMIYSVKDVMLNMCQDPQGSHVIEKMIIIWDEDLIKFIYETIIDNYMLLANNVNGLCVCKKVIIHGQNIETLEAIREKLVENALTLIQNPYGNYSIQIAFDYWSNDFVLPIVQQFYNKFYNLSMQKYSSNVVEKCLEKGDEQVITKFIEEVCQHTRVIDLMKNSYGNYVVQKALKISTGSNKSKLVSAINKNLDKLSDKKLINKWKAIVNNSTHLNTGLHQDMNLSGLNLSSSSINSNHSVGSHSPQMRPNNLFVNVQPNTMSRTPTGSPRIVQNFMFTNINNNPCHAANKYLSIFPPINNMNVNNNIHI